MRTVAACQNVGLDSEQEPCATRGVRESAKNKVDKIEDDDDQVDHNFEPVTAQWGP